MNETCHLSLSQADLWFQSVPIDMDWVNRVMLLAMAVLGRMERWHSVLSIGEEWVRVSEGAFNDKVLPIMLQVRRRGT